MGAEDPIGQGGGDSAGGAPDSGSTPPGGGGGTVGSDGADSGTSGIQGSLNDPLNQKPPANLADTDKREVIVQTWGKKNTRKVNTIRMPNDPKHPDKSIWYTSSGKDTGNPMLPIREQSQVIFMIDGVDRGNDENQQPGSQTLRTYTMMEQAIKSANASGHFIYLLNWYFSDDYSIGDTTMLDLLKQASSSGVEIRALFWQQKGFNAQTIAHYLGPIAPALLALIPIAGWVLLGIIAAAILAALLAALAKGNVLAQNQKGVNDINALPTGAAVLDDNTLNFGSHHQKLLVVNGSQGLIGFCGGIDFNPDRVFAQGQNKDVEGLGAPLHDTHVQITGPGAVDVLKTFVDRWTTQPDVLNMPANKQALTGASMVNSPPAAAGEQMVQIGRTFGNGSNHAGIVPDKYSFAPNGERTAGMVIAHAIQSAKRFIYIEDQYFTNKNLGKLLVDALPNVQHITILMPHGTIGDQPDGRFHRHKIIEELQNQGGEKVRVFCRAVPVMDTGIQNDPHVVLRNGQHFNVKPNHSYIHSKLVIVDDRFACVGSANSNSRGWTYDSEITAGIFDESHDDKMTLHFAHRMRIKVWAEHLKMDTAQGHAELWDGVASAAHWDRLPPLSRVIRYNKSDNTKPAGASNEPQDYKDDEQRYSIPVLGLVPGLDAILVNSDFFFDTFVDPDGS